MKKASAPPSSQSSGAAVAIGEGTVPATAVLVSNDADGEPIYFDSTPLRDNDPIYQAILSNLTNLSESPNSPIDPDVVITFYP